MKILNFILDNWWLILGGYGLWRAVTKKSAGAEASRKRLERAADALNAKRNEATIERYMSGNEPATSEDSRMYQFDSPVEEEEQRDEAQEQRDALERMRAFTFVPAEQETKPLVADESDRDVERRQTREQLQRVYSVEQVAAPSLMTTLDISFGPSDIRRAVILSEILLPPRSRRLHR